MEVETYTHKEVVEMAMEVVVGVTCTRKEEVVNAPAEAEIYRHKEVEEMVMVGEETCKHREEVGI